MSRHEKTQETKKNDYQFHKNHRHLTQSQEKPHDSQGGEGRVPSCDPWRRPYHEVPVYELLRPSEDRKISQGSLGCCAPGCHSENTSLGKACHGSLPHGHRPLEDREMHQRLGDHEIRRACLDFRALPRVPAPPL